MKFRNPYRDNASVQTTTQEDLAAENQLLKLKLEMQFGLTDINTVPLQPAMENEWLTNIYNFEQRHKSAKIVKVFDFLGQPEFKKTDELAAADIGPALDRILALMRERRVALDCNGEYEKSVIYRFITEELFQHPIEDVLEEGTVNHFLYEEFHPNHDYDLRHYAEEFIGIVFRKKWDRFDSHCFAANVQFKATDYDNDGIAAIIQTFQEAHDSLAVDQFVIDEVVFDLEKGQAAVSGLIRYDAKGYARRAYGGTCKITFQLQWGYWYINGFRLPGFGD